MGTGILALVAVDLAGRGVPAADIAATLETRKADIDLFVGLDTLAYLRKGGRLSGPKQRTWTVGGLSACAAS